MLPVETLNVSGAGVDELRGMLGNHADLILCHQLLDRHTSKRSVDMQSLRQDGRSDQLILRGFLVQLLVSVLVEKDQVVRLLLNL